MQNFKNSLITKILALVIVELFLWQSVCYAGDISSLLRSRHNTHLRVPVANEQKASNEFKDRFDTLASGVKHSIVQRAKSIGQQDLSLPGVDAGGDAAISSNDKAPLPSNNFSAQYIKRYYGLPLIIIKDDPLQKIKSRFNVDYKDGVPLLLHQERPLQFIAYDEAKDLLDAGRVVLGDRGESYTTARFVLVYTDIRNELIRRAQEKRVPVTVDLGEGECRVDLQIPQGIDLNTKVNGATFVIDCDGVLTQSGRDVINPEIEAQIERGHYLVSQRPEERFLKLRIISGSAYKPYAPTDFWDYISEWDWDELAQQIGDSVFVEKMRTKIMEDLKKRRLSPSEVRAFPGIQKSLEHRVMRPILQRLKDADLLEYVDIKIKTMMGGEDISVRNNRVSYKKDEQTIFEKTEQLNIAQEMIVTFLKAFGEEIGVDFNDTIEHITQAQSFLDVGEIKGVKTIFNEAVHEYDVSLKPFDTEFEIYYRVDGAPHGYALTRTALQNLQRKGCLSPSTTYYANGGAHYMKISLLDKHQEAQKWRLSKPVIRGGDTTVDISFLRESDGGISMYFGDGREVMPHDNIIIAQDAQGNDATKSDGFALLLKHVFDAMENSDVWGNVKFCNNLYAPFEILDNLSPEGYADALASNQNRIHALEIGMDGIVPLKGTWKGWYEKTITIDEPEGIHAMPVSIIYKWWWHRKKFHREKTNISVRNTQREDKPSHWESFDKTPRHAMQTLIAGYSEFVGDDIQKIVVRAEGERAREMIAYMSILLNSEMACAYLKAFLEELPEDISEEDLKQAINTSPWDIEYILRFFSGRILKFGHKNIDIQQGFNKTLYEFMRSIHGKKEEKILNEIFFIKDKTMQYVNILCPHMKLLVVRNPIASNESSAHSPEQSPELVERVAAQGSQIGSNFAAKKGGISRRAFIWSSIMGFVAWFLGIKIDVFNADKYYDDMFESMRKMEFEGGEKFSSEKIRDIINVVKNLSRNRNEMKENFESLIIFMEASSKAVFYSSKGSKGHLSCAQVLTLFELSAKNEQDTYDVNTRVLQRGHVSYFAQELQTIALVIKLLSETMQGLSGEDALECDQVVSVIYKVLNRDSADIKEFVLPQQDEKGRLEDDHSIQLYLGLISVIESIIVLNKQNFSEVCLFALGNLRKVVRNPVILERIKTAILLAATNSPDLCALAEKNGFIFPEIAEHIKVGFIPDKWQWQGIADKPHEFPEKERFVSFNRQNSTRRKQQEDVPDVIEVRRHEFSVIRSNNGGSQSIQTQNIRTCIALTLYDYKTQTEVVAHFDVTTSVLWSMRFILANLIRFGITNPRDLQARLIGGETGGSSRTFGSETYPSERLIASVQDVLSAYDINIVEQDLLGEPVETIREIMQDSKMGEVFDYHQKTPITREGTFDNLIKYHRESMGRYSPLRFYGAGNRLNKTNPDYKNISTVKGKSLPSNNLLARSIEKASIASNEEAPNNLSPHSAAPKSQSMETISLASNAAAKIIKKAIKWHVTITPFEEKIHTILPIKKLNMVYQATNMKVYLIRALLSKDKFFRDNPFTIERPEELELYAITELVHIVGIYAFSIFLPCTPETIVFQLVANVIPIITVRAFRSRMLKISKRFNFTEDSAKRIPIKNLALTSVKSSLQTAFVLALMAIAGWYAQWKGLSIVSLIYALINFTYVAITFFKNKTRMPDRNNQQNKPAILVPDEITKESSTQSPALKEDQKPLPSNISYRKNITFTLNGQPLDTDAKWALGKYRLGLITLESGTADYSTYNYTVIEPDQREKNIVFIRGGRIEELLEMPNSWRQFLKMFYEQFKPDTIPIFIMANREQKKRLERDLANYPSFGEQFNPEVVVIQQGPARDQCDTLLEQGVTISVASNGNRKLDISIADLSQLTTTQDILENLPLLKALATAK